MPTGRTKNPSPDSHGLLAWDPLAAGCGEDGWAPLTVASQNGPPSCILFPTHVKRYLNQWVDDLTRHDFQGFDSSLQLEVHLYWRNSPFL